MIAKTSIKKILICIEVLKNIPIKTTRLACAAWASVLALAGLWMLAIVGDSYSLHLIDSFLLKNCRLVLPRKFVGVLSNLRDSFL